MEKKGCRLPCVGLHGLGVLISTGGSDGLTILDPRFQERREKEKGEKELLLIGERDAVG